MGLYIYTFYKWGDLLVLITGITRATTVVEMKNCWISLGFHWDHPSYVNRKGPQFVRKVH